MRWATIMRALLLAIAIASGISAAAQDATGDIRPAPYQVAWQDLEFGVIIHFSTNTFLNQEWGDGTASPSIFNPAQLRSRAVDEGHPRFRREVRRPGRQAS